VSDPREPGEGNLRLHTASVDEAEAIAALINEAFRVEAFFIDGDRIQPAKVREMMARGAFLVAEDGAGPPVGCVYVEAKGESGYLGLLSVDPARQGGGLGRRLTAAAEDYCRAAGCTEIGIRVVNLRDVLPPFYRRLGYVEVGIEPFPADLPTKLPCHFLRMAKPL